MAYESHDGIFFCGNTYKNTLQNVTANRRIFFEFPNENPEKNRQK